MGHLKCCCDGRICGHAPNRCEVPVNQADSKVARSGSGVLEKPALVCDQCWERIEASKKKPQRGIPDDQGDHGPSGSIPIPRCPLAPVGDAQSGHVTRQETHLLAEDRHHVSYIRKIGS